MENPTQAEGTLWPEELGNSSRDKKSWFKQQDVINQQGEISQLDTTGLISR